MSKVESGLKSIAEGRSDIFKIDPRKLKIKQGWNNRDFDDATNQEHVASLAHSIAQIGVKEPLTVYWEAGQAWVSDGECRLRGTMYAIETLKADIKTIPVKTEDRYANEADRLFSQQIRNSGKPFTVLEQAKLFKRLLDLGWQQTDIASKSGLSNARVSQILDFNTLPEGVKIMVNAGTVAPTVAMNTFKANGKDAEKNLQKGLAVAQAQGKTKVMDKHVAEATGAEPKVNVKTAVMDAFEYADIDDSADDIVIIKMPADKWEIFKDILKL